MNGRLKFFLTFLFFQIYQNEAKLDYNIDDFIMEYVNETYFEPDSFDVSINYNDGSHNTLNIRFKVIKDLPKKVKANIGAYGGVLGHYKIPLLILNSLEVCKPFNYNFYFSPVISPLGITLEECPAKKGEYAIDDLYPDIAGVPDVPKGFIHSSVCVQFDIYADNFGDLFKFKVFCKV